MADSKLLAQIEKFDVNDLELGEAADMEDEFGCRIDEIDFGTTKAMAYMLYLIRRREDPAYTLDDARKIKLSAFNEEPNGNGDRPTKAAPKGGKKRAASGARS